MNRIHKSLEKIQASKELKKNTLQYLNEQRKKKENVGMRFAPGYVVAAVCLCLLIGVGGRSVYRRPVSYISIDVNPSIELEINCFGKVTAADAYNDDGKGVIEQLPLKNVPYMQAIDRMLQDENYKRYLKEDSMLIFTIISDHAEEIADELNASGLSQKYGVLTYTSDSSCREEAHKHEMSFGKYRTYLELLQYDENITIDDCHSMSMGELRDRIDACSHEGGENEEGEHHGEHHGDHHK